MVQLFMDGGGFMWPILFIFIIGLVFVIERLYHLFKGLSSNEEFAQEIAETVKEEDKKILLDFLKGEQGKSSQTLSLKKKKDSKESKEKKTVAITRKRISKGPNDEVKRPDDPERIDFSEIERKRLQGEAFKKSEDKRR